MKKKEALYTVRTALLCSARLWAPVQGIWWEVAAAVAPALVLTSTIHARAHTPQTLGNEFLEHAEYVEIKRAYIVNPAPLQPQEHQQQLQQPQEQPHEQ